MKSGIRQTYKMVHRLMRFVCVVSAINCLIKCTLDVECVNTRERWQNRSRRAVYYADIHWVKEDHIYIIASLGSNRQSFNLLIDTFDDATWVASILATSPAWATRNRFDAHQSTTFVEGQPEEFFAQHINYRVGGNNVHDTIQVAGMKIQKFPFKVGIGMPQQAKFPEKVDGVIGLSYAVHSGEKRDTFLEAMINSYPREYQSFGIKLCRDKGLLTLGEYCETCASGTKNILSMPDDTRFWKVKLIYVEFHKYVQMDEPGEVHFVTSCGSIQGPANNIQRINEYLKFPLNVDGTYYSEEPRHPQSRSVKFSISNQMFVFGPKDYTRKDIHGREYSIFRETGVDKDFWIFGLPFFLNRYIFFDKKGNNIVVAPAKCD